jgi:hypothetical protein
LVFPFCFVLVTHLHTKDRADAAVFAVQLKHLGKREARTNVDVADENVLRHGRTEDRVTDCGLVVSPEVLLQPQLSWFTACIRVFRQLRKDSDKWWLSMMQITHDVGIADRESQIHRSPLAFPSPFPPTHSGTIHPQCPATGTRANSCLSAKSTKQTQQQQNA